MTLKVINMICKISYFEHFEVGSQTYYFKSHKHDVQSHKM